MEIVNSQYLDFIAVIKKRIGKVHLKTYKYINTQQIKLYFEIGKLIVDKQEQLGWGNSIVEQLSRDLLIEYGQNAGFSARNLWNMKKLYIEYRSFPKLQQAVAEIPWGHNLLILEKIGNIDEREYYIKCTKKFGWTRSVLLNQIKANAYKISKFTNKQNNFISTLPENLAEQATESMKSIYTLNFLGISQPVRERELEKCLLNNVKEMIMELGYGFCFIGSQYKVNLGNKEYFIDLLFYHRILRCLIAIELKTVEFEPEFAGKMNFYLEVLDKKNRRDDENPSIGIILCPEKDRLVVEYALKTQNKPIGVAEYRFTTELPKYLKGKLPTSKEIENALKNDRNK